MTTLKHKSILSLIKAPLSDTLPLAPPPKKKKNTPDWANMALFSVSNTCRVSNMSKESQLPSWLPNLTFRFSSLIFNSSSKRGMTVTWRNSQFHRRANDNSYGQMLPMSIKRVRCDGIAILCVTLPFLPLVRHSFERSPLPRCLYRHWQGRPNCDSNVHRHTTSCTVTKLSFSL